MVAVLGAGCSRTGPQAAPTSASGCWEGHKMRLCPSPPSPHLHPAPPTPPSPALQLEWRAHVHVQSKPSFWERLAAAKKATPGSGINDRFLETAPVLQGVPSDFISVQLAAQVMCNICIVVICVDLRIIFFAYKHDISGQYKHLSGNRESAAQSYLPGVLL